MICFEPVSQATEVPCACNVVYCIRCWDRSLAHSFNASGQATCPTCRGRVCVDFDAEKGCLVFSREVASFPTDLGVQQAMDKLRQQARPTQIRLLRQHGVANPALQEMVQDPERQLRKFSVAQLKEQIISLGGRVDDCLEKEDLARRLLEHAGDTDVLAGVLGTAWANVVKIAPSCVCGCALERVSGMERARRVIEKVLPAASPGSQIFLNALERLTSSGSVCFCDLCGELVPLKNPVWTCQNGNSTILHTASYDVCDRCFVDSACGRNDLTTVSHEAPAVMRLD